MKNESKFLIAASLGLLSITSTAFADEEVKVAPSLGSVLEASGITATGYVAASYYYSSGENTYHNFDTAHDTFQLDQASLTLAYQPKEGFGGVAQIIAGEDATILSTTSPSTFAVAQAYAQYAAGSFTLIAGKYWTLAGAEITAPNGNTNFSRSLLFTYEPAYHTGVRGTVAFSDSFSLMFGVNNGWNYDKVFSTGSGGNASMKTGELGFSLAPSKKFSLAAVGYIGKDPTYDAQRSLVDLVATINATDALSFVVSYDTGSQDFVTGGSAKWDGVAAYANVAFNDQFRLSLRLEQFNDKDGFETGTVQKLKEGTLTFGYAPTKNIEWRFEVRQDKSDQSTFVKTDGTTDDTQFEFALQGVYKF